jgi:FMN-dependent oxidoreductase (nitrilotriacetate monooxygenase family)
MQRQLHLNLFIQSRGHHEASWRHPDASALDLADIDYYRELALSAEAACFDAIFLADVLALDQDYQHAARNWLEPVTALSALAGATRHIGLIGTVSTTYTEPFNLARQFASLDHISRGRAGWNVVTSSSAAAARNYSGDSQRSHADRYACAEEFMQVVKALWDSWTDDAVVDDRTTGRYISATGVRAVDHSGEHYQVTGPFNLPRSPQGWPVLVQAGSSSTGRQFAARHAEAVFTAHMDKALAQEFYADLKRLAELAGRHADSVLILPGVSPVIASTESEAHRYADELNALSDPEVGRSRLSYRFGGQDFSHLALDKVLVAEDFPATDTVEASRSRTEVIVGLVRKEPLTLRQLLAKLASARGHFTLAGTPEQVADHIESWFVEGAADGFNIMPPVLPAMFTPFVDEVLPLLRQRGLFRRKYAGVTLRDHYGLKRPSGR